MNKQNLHEYKIGLHIHTTLFDGVLNPEAAARVYKDAIVGVGRSRGPNGSVWVE